MDINNKKGCSFPFFSIIVPVYKVEEYLSECIDSVLMQSFLDYELILVDDCSPDKCGQICDEYSNLDKRIKVIHLQKNKGLSAARNAGMEVASGKYWTFLDSDDYWSRDILSELHTIFSNEKDLDAVRGRFQDFDSQSRKIGKTSVLLPSETQSGLEFLKSMIDTGLVEHGSPFFFFKGDLFKTTNLKFIEGYIAEDFEWLPRLLSAIGKIRCVNKPYYMYRVKRQGSIINSPQAAAGCIRTFKKVLDELDERVLKHPVLHEYYCNSLPALITYIGLLEKQKRKEEFRKLHKYHWLLNTKFKKGKIIIAFITIFGKKRYGYPFYLINSTRMRLRRWKMQWSH
jgi:glycosyltransferase involved in cell wall biosynthesis